MSLPVELVTSALLRDWRLPEPGAGKKSRGQVIVVGGSPSTPGAVMLAGLAALRVGAGVLSLAVAGSVSAAVAAAVPEASVIGLPELDDEPRDGRLEKQLSGCSVVLVGPGLDDAESALELVDTVVRHADDDAWFVADAYALGVLTRSDSRSTLAGRCVLTPNRAEAERLLEHALDDDADDAASAAEIAQRFDAVVSYQGCVADRHGRAWRVPAGHPGLGTSGSGDVLAGAVTGLLARGADAHQAACWATFLHAVAGERLAARVGRLGFLARELVDQLPIVLTETEA
jgi:ADP-dependent NAD(P)H-hydrate dehydratase